MNSLLCVLSTAFLSVLTLTCNVLPVTLTITFFPTLFYRYFHRKNMTKFNIFQKETVLCLERYIDNYLVLGTTQVTTITMSGNTKFASKFDSTFAF